MAGRSALSPCGTLPKPAARANANRSICASFSWTWIGGQRISCKYNAVGEGFLSIKVDKTVEFTCFLHALAVGGLCGFSLSCDAGRYMSLHSVVARLLPSPDFERFEDRACLYGGGYRDALA